MKPYELEVLTALRRAKDMIDRDYAKPLDVPTMAAKAMMSPAHFSRQFKATYGQSPYAYLMTRRIERSMALLRSGMSVTDACMEVGCTSLGSFSTSFTQITGESPSGYRNREHTAVEAMPACIAKSVTRPKSTRVQRYEQLSSLPAPDARGWPNGPALAEGHLDRPRPVDSAESLAVLRYRAGSKKRTRGLGAYRGAMDISLQYSHITVNDVDEAIPFYRDGLGLRVENDVASGEHRWVTLASDTQPGLGIVLSDPHAGRSEADGNAMQELLTKGVLPMTVFSTSDLDGLFEQVRATGAEVLQEPIDQPWGPKDCAFRDPSGNMIRLSQR